MKDKKLVAALAALALYLEGEKKPPRPSPWRLQGRWELLHRDPRARYGRGSYERPRQV